MIGIDPGSQTGMAVFEDGHLVSLETYTPVQLVRDFLFGELVVFEDSRNSPIFAGSRAHGSSRAAAMKMARAIGEIDAWCRLIEDICKREGIKCVGISPKQKGRKLNAAEFRELTGWTGQTNQHERDAAMVAWPYRNSSEDSA